MTLAMAESQRYPAAYTDNHPETVVYHTIGGWSPASLPIENQPVWTYQRAREGTKDFRSALREVAKLKANWDSYGAAPFDPIVIERARSLILYLVTNDVPSPRIIPAASGSLLLEWSTDLVHLEIDIDPVGEDSVFIEKKDGSAIEYVGNLVEITELYRRELNSALTYLMFSNRISLI